MFQRIFNPENGFFQGCARILDAALLSLLWLVLCLPVVTAGPASAALYYTSVKCLRRGERAPYANFFRCFRENFRTGAAAGVLLAVVWAVLLIEHNMLSNLARAGFRPAQLLWYAFAVVAVLVFGAGCYVCPLLSRFTCTLGGLFARAGQLALRHLPSTLALAAVNLAAVWLCVHFALLLFPLLLLPAGAALVSSLLLERIFRRYTPDSGAEGEERPWYLR